MVLDGRNLVGIVGDECVHGRIVGCAGTTARVGKALEQQNTLVLCIGLQGEQHQQRCNDDGKSFHVRMVLSLFFCTKIDIFQKMAMFLLQDWEKFCIFAG
jgi:hypothetical protein